MCQLVIMELGGGTRRGSADRPEQSLRSLGPPPSGLPLHPLCTTYTKPQPPAAALTVGRTETQKCTESKSSSQSHSHTCRVPAGPYTHDVGRLQGMQSGRREARYQNPPSTAVTAPKKARSDRVHLIAWKQQNWDSLRVREADFPSCHLLCPLSRVRTGQKYPCKKWLGNPKSITISQLTKEGHIYSTNCAEPKLICLRFLKRLNLFFSPENLM